VNNDYNDYNDRDDDLGAQGDENSLKGKMNQASDNVQEKWGELTGDRSQEAKGMGKQLTGHAQEGLGDTERDTDDDDYNTDDTLNP
jgi:uncharacterized protein YjbJ (UPF0337 family)